MKIDQYSPIGALIIVAICIVSIFISALLCSSKNREVWAYIVFAICGCLLFVYIDFWSIFFCVFFVVFLMTDKTHQFREQNKNE